MKQRLHPSARLKTSLIYGAGCSLLIILLLTIWFSLDNSKKAAALQRFGIRYSIAEVKFTGIFPEPFIDKFNISIQTDKPSEIIAGLYNPQRKLIKEIGYEIEPGTNKLLFNPGCFMMKGIYILKINQGQQLVYSGKIICK
jgi:hypothetical protein